jgi:hypothetical protein
MPNILFFGDNHSHFDHIIEAVEREKPDAIVLLGDIEAQRPLEVELAPILGNTVIRLIPGNHEVDSDLTFRNLFESKLAHCNLDGRVEEVVGVRIAGLGGIFRSKIWAPPEAPKFDSYADWLIASRRSQKPGAFDDQVLSTAARTHQTTIFWDVYERRIGDGPIVHRVPVGQNERSRLDVNLLRYSERDLRELTGIPTRARALNPEFRVASQQGRCVPVGGRFFVIMIIELREGVLHVDQQALILKVALHDVPDLMGQVKRGKGRVSRVLGQEHCVALAHADRHRTHAFGRQREHPKMDDRDANRPTCAQERLELDVGRLAQQQLAQCFGTNRLKRSELGRRRNERGRERLSVRTKRGN